MEIKSEINRFYIEENETLVGEVGITKINDSTISIDHTFVSEDHRGQGLAKKLLNAALEYAEQNNLKIVPVCSYAKAEFKNDPKIQHLLTENYQELLGGKK
ncbi:GNAT family N-acetyltransferase [Companilactobacillus baiquanensis]|uniref:GNAT family N-acetyltransferase n=1 Tax=Companilactobacillus baiquanensis TaxID=2486005 RepID=A0ABW1UVX5_9LACO|nr:GNAT family N-acetyltransferase [Companilactobacillus baiquanensis]